MWQRLQAVAGAATPCSKGRRGRRRAGEPTRPPTEEQSAELVAGLWLDGSPLEPPRFHPVAWRAGDRFTEADDPDRTREPFPSPSFVRRDPAEQRARTWCEELPLPDAPAGSFARVVHDVLDERACAELIALINRKGFTPALLNVGGGRQMLEPTARDGHRAVVDSKNVSKWMDEVLRPYLPAMMHGRPLVELNERLRILCYIPGQEFPTHLDGSYVRPRGHPRVGDASKVTVQVHLHDVPEENGGATTFVFGSAKPLPCQPKAGSALIFSQDLPHEGSMLHSGIKYTLRTEAMYGVEDSPGAAVACRGVR